MPAASTSGRSRSAREGTLAFLFPGEGSQYPGMLADLCPHFPELRAVLDTADRIARESGEEVPPSQHLFGGPGPIPAASGRPTPRSPPCSRPSGRSSRCCRGWACARRGRRPQQRRAARAGGRRRHPDRAGPRAAARRAGCGLSRAGSRAARSPRPAWSPSGPIARGPRRRAASPAPSVVGRHRQLPAPGRARRAPGRGRPRRRPAPRRRRGLRGAALRAGLPHAGFARPCSSRWTRSSGAWSCTRSRIPVYSCSTAGRMPESPEEIRRLAVAQWTRPVAFRDTIEAMYRDGLRVFVDVGARGNLAATSRTSSAVGPRSPWPPTCPAARERPSSTTWWRRSSPRGSRSTPPISTRGDGPAASTSTDPPHRRGPFRIELGFPEMRLSEDVIARLRGAIDPEDWSQRTLRARTGAR